MCKFNPKNDSRKIDNCMKRLIAFINENTAYETLACCCGHGKYDLTIVVRLIGDEDNEIFELCSGKIIPRKKKFYKKDKQRFYYIPEVSNER